MTTLEPTKIVDAAGPGEDDAPLTVAEGGIEALPRGDAYPIFLGFPKRAVDFASSERERIRAEEDAVLARQKVVKNLSARTEELRRMEAAWEAELPVGVVQHLLEPPEPAALVERLRRERAFYEETLAGHL